MKKGFTLAEVLITLGIIGVVAAITMPTLIAHYQKQVTVNQLKKVYTVLSQAVKQSELDNDNAEYWDYTDSPKIFFEKYLKKYLKINEELEFQSLKEKGNITYRYLNGGQAGGCIGNNVSYAVILSDGVFLIIDAYYPTDGSKFRTIAVDINGYKRPNQLGKDVFYLQVVPFKGVIPYPVDDFSSCKKGKVGYSCAQKIIEDSWKITKDYPW